MNDSLFHEFKSVSSKAWKQKIQVDLKGADYNDTLIWKTNEGINVKPFYHADNFKTFPDTSDTKASEWKICQEIEVSDAKSGNLKAIDAINRGADSIFFQIKTEEVEIEDLLRHIDSRKIIVEIKCQFHSESYYQKLLKIRLSVAEASKINIQVDIIGNLAKTGNWYRNLKEDHSKFITTISETTQLNIDMGLYQNAGATCIQQLAYGLAHVNEYLNTLSAILTKKANQSLQVTFKVAIGSNYFFEIAKIRALRQLWTILALEYNVNTMCRIIARPSKRNKTIFDYNTNMLRTTTECMSAILGGANIICNRAYDSLYHKPNEFGERISRNQLLVLKQESYFDKVNNPVDGAYYIESLTTQLANQSLSLFKNIEANGGFLKQLKEGTIQRKIQESATREQSDFDSGNLVLLGTNKHPNLNEKMKNNLEISPFLKFKKRKTLIQPIIKKRLSEKLEINRLKKE